MVDIEDAEDEKKKIKTREKNYSKTMNMKVDKASSSYEIWQ
jgi:hypothetical protein